LIADIVDGTAGLELCFKPTQQVEAMFCLDKAPDIPTSSEWIGSQTALLFQKTP
jgi:hypothetical protein